MTLCPQRLFSNKGEKKLYFKFFLGIHKTFFILLTKFNKISLFFYRTPEFMGTLRKTIARERNINCHLCNELKLIFQKGCRYVAENNIWYHVFINLGLILLVPFCFYYSSAWWHCQLIHSEYSFKFLNRTVGKKYQEQISLFLHFCDQISISYC